MSDRIENSGIKKERNAGIDLLRILAMMCVVLVHVLEQDGAMNAAVSGRQSTYYALKLIQVFGYCAVPIYATVSGYVGVGKKWKPSNLILLIITALFYTVVFSVIFYLLKPNEVGVGGMIKSMIPDYWYLMCYCGLFLFMPLLNKALESFTQKNLFNILLILFLVLSCTSPLFMAMNRDPFRLIEGYSVIWLMVFYLVGGYLKLYGLCKTKVKRKMGLLLTVCVLATFFSKVATNLLGYGNMNLLYHYTSPTIFLASVACVVLFSNMKIKEGAGKVVTYISAFTFSVYLIHQQELVNVYCVVDRFRWVADCQFIVSVLATFVCALAIYVLCTLIDVVRLYLFRFLRVKSIAVWLEKQFAKVGSWLTHKMKFE